MSKEEFLQHVTIGAVLAEPLEASSRLYLDSLQFLAEPSFCSLWG